VAFSAFDHIIPIGGRFNRVLFLIRRILCEAVYGVFPIGHVINAFDSVPFFSERASFERNEKELLQANSQLQHDLELQKKQMSRCIDRLDSAKADFFGMISSTNLSACGTHEIYRIERKIRCIRKSARQAF
jgi:hypothetical protein